MNEPSLSLALVADRRLDRRAVGLEVVDLVDVLRVGVDVPDEAVERAAGRVRVLRLADQHAVARGVGVRADLLDDLHRVVVEARRDVRAGGRRVPRALAGRVRVVAARRVLVAAVEQHAHAGEIAVGLDLTRLDLGHGDAGLGQPVAVEAQDVVVGDEVQEALVAQVVLRAEGAALGRRDLEAGVLAARAR